MEANQVTLSGVKALLFDMDGVIVDSEPLHLLAFQEFLSAYDIDYTEEHNREFLGTKDTWIAKILIERFKLPHTPEEFVQRKEEILTRLLSENAIPRPGLIELLEKGKRLKLPMAIASSATLKTIHLVIDTLRIRDYFSALASGEEVSHGKPAPDVFLLAAKRLGVAPHDCLVIEDTLNGIKAAKAAGMKCIAIPCDATKHQDHSQADRQMQSLTQVDLDTFCRVC